MKYFIPILFAALISTVSLPAMEAFAGGPGPFPPIDEENEIFDNGRGDPTQSGPRMADSAGFWADDFVLEQDTFLRDIHFDGRINQFNTGDLSTFQFDWAVFLDEGGLPGDLVASGEGKNEGQELIEEDFYRFWFDLDVPVYLEGDLTYWVSIGANPMESFDIDWIVKDPEFGNNLAQFTGSFWEEGAPNDFNFILTGGEQKVAGELLPLDSTALFLAGIQSMTVWMVPTVLGLTGVGVYLVKFRKQ